MSSGIISTAQLSTHHQLTANKGNYPTWKVQVEEYLAGKGIKSYITEITQSDGTTTPTIARPTTTTTTTPAPTSTSTAVYSRNPSQEEWDYRDGVAKSVIVTNIIDPIGLGIKRDGTALECWKSVASACAPKSDAALSLAEEEFTSLKFAGTTRDELDLHFNEAFNLAHNVRMLGKDVEDKKLKNIIIRSLPPRPEWLGLAAALYASPDSNSAIASIKAHAINVRMPKEKATTTAFVSGSSGRRCTNSNCKAINKSSHVIENCYWPGGGKEGQFPANFGKRKMPAPQANQASGAPVVESRVLAARCATVEDGEDAEREPGVVIEEIFTTPPPFQRTPSMESICVQETLSREGSDDGWVDVFPNDGEEMPALQDVSDGEDEDIDTYSSDEDEVEDFCPPVVEYILDNPIAAAAVAGRTFESMPASHATFYDSGASDHFFRDRADFTSYEATPYRTGTSALSTEGDFHPMQ